MRELPILFSTPMVQAILDGRKSMTRRVVKPQPLYVEPTGSWVWPIPKSKVKPCCCTEVCSASREWWEYLLLDQMPYQPGDTLWVRETWQCVKYDSMDGDLSYGVEFKDGARKYFEFDDNERYHQFGKFAFKEGWQPSIYLPREAARIWLEVTNVRVERLQEILCGDMKREGCIPDTVVGGQYQQWQRDYWIPLWDSVNKKRGYGWETNPWVWVISFKRVNKCH
jgi:hypothetical protein